MTEQLQAALVPFLAMARACKYLPEHETIAARVSNLRLVYLDAQDFRALALAVEQQGLAGSSAVISLKGTTELSSSLSSARLR